MCARIMQEKDYLFAYELSLTILSRSGTVDSMFDVRTSQALLLADTWNS